MGILAVATDYWTFKPLFFASQRTADLQILTFNFKDGTPNTLASNNRFVRGTSTVVVKNLARCRSINPSDRDSPGNCSEEWFTSNLGVARRMEVCGKFETIETIRPLDFTSYASIFQSKWSAFMYNLKKNFGKFLSRVKVAGIRFCSFRELV